MDVTFQVENQLKLKEEETSPRKERKTTPQEAGKACGLKAVSRRVACRSKVGK